MPPKKAIARSPHVWSVVRSCNPSGAELFPSADYAVFAHPDFDPNDYANAVLAGELYPATSANPPVSATLKSFKAAPAKNTSTGSDAEDISVAISKLTFNLDDVEKQIKHVVSSIRRSFALALTRYRSRRAMRICLCTPLG